MITQDQKDDLIYEKATLDGSPATIRGRLLKYAVVSRIYTPSHSVEFAWDTVAHIVANRGGAFKS